MHPTRTSSAASNKTIQEREVVNGKGKNKTNTHVTTTPRPHTTPIKSHLCMLPLETSHLRSQTLQLILQRRAFGCEDLGSSLFRLRVFRILAKKCQQKKANPCVHHLQKFKRFLESVKFVDMDKGKKTLRAAAARPSVAWNLAPASSRARIRAWASASCLSLLTTIS